MGWTKTWLSYSSVKDYPDSGLFSSYEWPTVEVDAHMSCGHGAVDVDAHMSFGHGAVSGTFFTDQVLHTAQKEFTQGVLQLLGKTPQLTADLTAGGICFQIDVQWQAKEAYRIEGSIQGVQVTASDEKGLLYGVFHLLREVALRRPVSELHLTCIPDNPLRMLNHWDNLDGSIERGYSGNSFFFQNDEILVHTPEEEARLWDYARMVASVGINAVVLNNVNVKQAATELIDRRYEQELRKISEIFASYGITLYLSLNFAAPMELGCLDSADPLDERVIDWWQAQMRQVFTGIPLLGGFLVKADSEGRQGPFTYGRNHADGANMLARAVAPYGGRIIWRCFVYNCQQDWRDKKTDRARSGYDNFMPLDGQFLDNVILQIKNGPMDFQVREPVHPLFGGLSKTNQMLEVQIAQEYTGQQRHVCYLIPMFSEILQFRTYLYGGCHDTVGDLIVGMAAVANTGNDENWTGHDMAAANLYGFGRLSFQTSLTAEEIAKEWSGLTFGTDPEVTENVVHILMASWPAYENFTSPLGLGWMVNPNHHYGPNPEGYEWDRWGTYHRADWRGVGVDRSCRKGTGYAGQYREPNASLYETIETCPEELLLFFHYVPYTYRLKSGKTLIQHIYDTHFEGAEMAAEFVACWKQLEGKIEPEAYCRVLARLEEAAAHSLEWRDRINTYFYRRCGIGDEKGRKIYT